jgi:transposase
VSGRLGLGDRVLGAIRAIGVDEIQRGKGHKYLTLVYQIDLGRTRLLWIGKERTVKTFKEFFAMIGPEVSAKIEFVCSDMWKPYLRVIREKCSQALMDTNRSRPSPAGAFSSGRRTSLPPRK